MNMKIEDDYAFSEESNHLEESLLDGDVREAVISDDDSTSTFQDVVAIEDQARRNREENRKCRRLGVKYVGVSNELQIEEPDRKLKPPCNSEYCRKSSYRKCWDITQSQRQKLFDHFWKQLNWTQRRDYISRLIERLPPKRRMNKVGMRSRRNETLLYYLPVDERKLQVCKIMFLYTFDIGGRMMQNFMNY